jgi:hypothetical protein
MRTVRFAALLDASCRFMKHRLQSGGSDRRQGRAGVDARFAMIKIRAPRDLLAGLLFIAIGAIGAWMAASYAFGSTLRMGPGYFPTVLSWGTILLGAIIALRSLAAQGDPLTRVGWRPLAMVLGSIVTFGLLINRTGLVIAIIATSIVGGLASREVGRIELVLLSLGLAVFCVLVFVYGLSQPFDLWPQ